MLARVPLMLELSKGGRPAKHAYTIHPKAHKSDGKPCGCLLAISLSSQYGEM